MLKDCVERIDTSIVCSKISIKANQYWITHSENFLLKEQRLIYNINVGTPPNPDHIEGFGSILGYHWYITKLEKKLYRLPSEQVFMHSFLKPLFLFYFMYKILYNLIKIWGKRVACINIVASSYQHSYFQMFLFFT